MKLVTTESDIPADVHAVVEQLLASSHQAFAEGDVSTGLSAVNTISTVATNKLSKGELRECLLHGCERVMMVTETEHEGRRIAMEYVAAMTRQFEAMTTQ